MTTDEIGADLIRPNCAYSIDAAVEAVFPDTATASSVVFDLDSFDLASELPNELTDLPWPAYDAADATGLLQLVDASFHPAVAGVRSRAKLTSIASATIQAPSGHPMQVSLLTFGTQTNYAVALFDSTTTMQIAKAAPDQNFRTRIECDFDGSVLAISGPPGSFACADVELGLWAENLVSPQDRVSFHTAVQSVLEGEPYAWIAVAGEAPGLHFGVTVARSGGAIIVDLNDRSHTVSALESLGRSQAQFDQLSATLPVGVFVVDAKGRVRFASDKLREFLGAENAGDLRWMHKVHPEDREIAIEMFADLPKTRHFNIEIRTELPSGDFGWSRWVGSAIHEENGELEHVVGFVEDISEWRALNSKIAYQASFDDLTGLPNRITIVEELRYRLEQQNPPEMTGVLFIDLDGFKLINDTQGHSVGDIVLLEVAQRFRRALRPTDLIGRFGGDEFIVVASDIADHEAAEALGRRLHDILATPVLAEGRIISVNASIGIALAEHDSASTEHLIGDADIAMYEAKDSGRNRTVVFDATLRARASQRFDMTADLRHARRRRELRLDYQPIVDLQHNRIIGAEALVRWDHPAMGRISPAVFIPLAEETGLIDDVGEWVVEQACADLDRLRNCGLADDDFTISVNASAHQFNNVAVLATSTLASLDQFGLKPANLRFELTESVPLTKIPEAANRIRQLTSYGFGLAIDDFGTGYSSLGYLTMLPFDILKLDLSLTAQLEPGAPALAMVDALTRMSHEMGFQIVAEGIETDKQHELLFNAGVQLGQGYNISRPVPLPELIDLLG